MPTQDETLLDIYSKFTLDELNRAHEGFIARNDSAHAALVKTAISRYGQTQTADLANCGQLFKHTHVDPETGRVTHTFTGDSAAFLKPFTEDAGPIACRMDTRNFTGANSPFAKAYAATQQTVTVMPGERIQIVKV